MLSTGQLLPSFSPQHVSYQAQETKGVTSVTVTATPTASRVMLSVNNVATAPGQPSAPIKLDPNKSTQSVVVKVTSLDGKDSKTYTVSITQAPTPPPAPPPAPPPDPHAHDATLSSLKVSSGALMPAFDSRTLEYKATAAVGVTSVTVTALPTDHGALLAVNNVAAAPGQPSSSIMLSKSQPTPVAVVVTASDDKTTTTYTVMYSLARAPPGPPPDVSLKALTVSKGTLTPKFSPEVYEYKAAEVRGTNAISVTATPKVPSCLVSVNNLAVAPGTPTSPISLSGSSTTIIVEVTSANILANQTYRIVAQVAGDSEKTDASLKSLVPSVSTFQPAFSPTVVAYGMNLPRQTPSITLTGTTKATGATMTSDDGNGAKPMPNGKPSQPLQIDSSKTSSTFFVVVTAPDNKTKSTYTIDVTLTADAPHILQLPATAPHGGADQWMRDSTVNASGLFVLTASVITNDEPQTQHWVALLVLPATIFLWGVGLVLQTVLGRVAKGRRPHRGLINDSSPALAVHFPAQSQFDNPTAHREPEAIGGPTFRLVSIADPATDIRRLCSLDALRGLALCMMIFCNGETGYPEIFEPSRKWVGVPTVADIVGPGFAWCLGFSLALVADMAYSRHATKAALCNKVFLRATCLLVIALGLQRTGHSKGISYLTPLSRLSAVYFVVGATLVATP